MGSYCCLQKLFAVTTAGRNSTNANDMHNGGEEKRRERLQRRARYNATFLQWVIFSQNSQNLLFQIHRQTLQPFAVPGRHWEFVSKTLQVNSVPYKSIWFGPTFFLVSLWWKTGQKNTCIPDKCVGFDANNKTKSRSSWKEWEEESGGLPMMHLDGHSVSRPVRVRQTRKVASVFGNRRHFALPETPPPISVRETSGFPLKRVNPTKKGTS